MTVASAIACVALGGLACGRFGYEGLSRDGGTVPDAATGDGASDPDGVAASLCAPADETACAGIEGLAGGVQTVNSGAWLTCGGTEGACAYDCLGGDCRATCSDTRPCALACGDSSCMVSCVGSGTCCLRCGTGSCRVCSGGCLLTCP